VRATAEHIKSTATSVQLVALAGFCFGGGRVVDVLASAARTNASTPHLNAASLKNISLAGLPITAGVSFYGTRISVDALSKVRTPLALYFASEDPLVPLTDIEEFQKVLETRPQDSGAHSDAGHSTTGESLHSFPETYSWQ
jgi:dienelactone hydrolase